MSLTLPKTIKIGRLRSKERELVQKFRDVVEGFHRAVESPIHISDLMEPRKAYWQRMKPTSFSDNTIMYFSLGYAGHEYLLGGKDGGTKGEGDLVWSPDGETDTTIVEVKITTKRQVASYPSELEKWVKQILSYMALEKKLQGEIWVWYVAKPEYPELVVFSVTATRQALDRYRKQIKKKAVILRDALTKNNPSELPLCSRELCYRSKCPNYDDCQPEGRWKPKPQTEASNA